VSFPAAFWKMHAQGNDFVFQQCPGGFDEDAAPEYARRVCDRHFGVGADGLILLTPALQGNDVRMHIYNSDGSKAEICGSALRCAIGWLHGQTGRVEFVVETIRGIHPGTVIRTGESPVTRVDMGCPQSLGMETIDDCEGHRIVLENPHFVIYTDRIPDDIAMPGRSLELAVPGGINVHFAQVIDRSTIRLHTWERGAGATLACGSGSCATVFSGFTRNLIGNRVEVRQPGGTVMVELIDGHAFLEGEVTHVFSGSLSLTDTL
jgi:diaminopimelate epimerase